MTATYSSKRNALMNAPRKRPPWGVGVGGPLSRVRTPKPYFMRPTTQSGGFLFFIAWEEYF